MDDFTPDNQATDDFTPDNAGMTGALPKGGSTSTIDTFRKLMSAHMLGPVAKQVFNASPQGQMFNTVFPADTAGTQTPEQSFQQDISTGNAQDTSVNDASAVYGLLTAPKAIAGVLDAGSALAGVTKNKFNSIMEILKAPGEAERLAPATTELQDGLAAKASQASELQAAKNTKDTLYGAIPKDVKASLPTLNSTAEDILNEIKGLSPKTQATVKALVSNYQDFGRSGAALGDIGVERSVLGDLARNGDGIEKMYAARLGKALQQDVENFSKTSIFNSPAAASEGGGEYVGHTGTITTPKTTSFEPTGEFQELAPKTTPGSTTPDYKIGYSAVPPSQQPEPFAADLRKAWVNRAVSEAGGDYAAGNAGAMTSDESDNVVNYLNRHKAAAPITNSDIGDNIKKANSYFKDFSDLQNHPVTQALAKARPEEMAAQIFKRGNVDDVNVAKAVLGDSFKNLQGQYYNQLKDASNLPAVLKKLSPDFIKAAFTPAQAQNLQRLGQFKALIAKAKLVGTIAGAGAALRYGEKLVK